MSTGNLVSFSGLFVFMGIAWLLSENKRNMNWRVIIWGVVLQLVFGLFIFVVPAGTKFFLWINDIVINVLDCASAGSIFVFGRLAVGPGQTMADGTASLGFFLAFQALPTIVFFSAVMSLLYFFRIMPLLLRGFAALFVRLMKVSGAEAMVNASNVFVGIESAFTVRPFMAKMTRSELAVVLTSGMATVASNVLALYVFSLKAQFPSIAGHLMSASILSAPAAMIMAKIIIPEMGRPETLGISIKPSIEREPSMFEAIINGARSGVTVVVGIVALLIAVLGIVAVVDLVLGGIGGLVNHSYGLHIDWTLKGLLGYAMYPFALIMGIPAADALVTARIIGERVILTEVASYFDLAKAMANGTITNPRSALITVYALCGFAHVASMAIFVGGTAALCPSRTREISGMALKTLVAATLACFMTACVAGTFYNGGSILLGR